jgi:hypothetical protein
MQRFGLDFDAARETAKAVMLAHLDGYEAAARAITEVEWFVARSAIYEPMGALMRAWADFTRDAIAVQLSTARWLLDL